MITQKATRTLLASVVGIAALIGGCYLLLRLFGVIDPGACISEEVKTIPNLSGTKVEIVYTNCDLLAKDEAVRIYLSKATGKNASWFERWLDGRTLVFRYDPATSNTPPTIESPGQGRILISVPRASSVAVKQQKWRNISIEYRIGHIDYP